MSEVGFSALQRAEIAEIDTYATSTTTPTPVSVLFNEPKLLKSGCHPLSAAPSSSGFSALQRAEIAEILLHYRRRLRRAPFQCSSTSRNC